MRDVYEKLSCGESLVYEDALKMLSVDVFSEDFYKIINYANTYARDTFAKGLIFSQIGIDAQACSADCSFCMLAASNFSETEKRKSSVEDIVRQAKSMVEAGTDEVFIMSTAEYDKAEFLEVGKAVRAILPKDMKMVANTADFDEVYAHAMKEAGFTGVYHICRLDEGVFTQPKLEDRIKTMDAVKSAGLELYYCVEPIGPEHTNEQIADEIFRAKDYEINVMAVMRRVCFDGSPMADKGEIDAVRLALITAVTVLCVRPNRAMGVHEPEIISLISGANQIYAENGTNPRDTEEKTEQGRGFSVYKAKAMLNDARWKV